ncbi:MAG: toprim domain-containing protein [Candidatus Pelagibacter sp.]|nr:toprim domain-containing protein [Candidatus Pelagibacter sp.]
MVDNQLLNVVERVLGNSYKLRNGEYQFFCHECNHHKRKLQINFDKNSSNFGKAHCWVCNLSAHTIPQLLRKLGAPKTLIKEALQLVDEYVSYEKDKNEIKHNVSLPNEYKPLYIKSNDLIYRHAMNYLKRRNITPQEIVRYSIGYCDSGDYSNRIIIPSYDCDGKLNYFVARDMFPNSKFKYKNPPMDKNIVCFELFVNYNEPLVIVEGVMDAIAVRKNVIPLLGKFLSKSLVKKLINKKVKTIYVALDNDARQDAIKLSKLLMDYGIETYLLNMDGKDPSEIGFKHFWELVGNTEQTTFSEFIKGKLNG